MSYYPLEFNFKNLSPLFSLEPKTKKKKKIELTFFLLAKEILDETTIATNFCGASTSTASQN